MSIYKACDIRGNAAIELSPTLYRRWGNILARQLAPGQTIVAGGDVRCSTPPFLAALIDGMCEGGAAVIDLGLLPTPMVYFAKRHLQAAACAIVTASHNPATVNGLKWMRGDRPPTPGEVTAMESGANLADPRPRGTVRTGSIAADYLAWLTQTFREATSARLTVVLDGMHGCWAGRAHSYLQAVFPQCVFATIRDTPDPQFRGGTPDPSQARYLTGLGRTVREENAALGVAFDGDGDRAGFVDNNGVPLRAEEATWTLLHSFGPELPGSGFVYDIKFSDRIPQAAQQLGAIPLLERSGHAFIRNRMCETGSVFGAEISGHYFYRDLHGGDDALYTACRMIALLARSSRSLAALRSACPPVHISPDLRVSLSPRDQASVVSHIRKTWSQYPQQTIDGVRIDTPGGWILVRSSVTEPALTFRFEGRDSTALENLVLQFCQSLPGLGEELRSKFLATH